MATAAGVVAVVFLCRDGWHMMIKDKRALVLAVHGSAIIAIMKALYGRHPLPSSFSFFPFGIVVALVLHAFLIWCSYQFWKALLWGST